MKKKILSLIMLFCLGLTGCVGKNAKETKDQSSTNNNGNKEKVVLEMLVPGYDSGYLKEQLDNLISKFQTENKGIEIKIVSAGWDELNTKVVQLYQAKKAPDLMLLGSRSLRQFAENKILEDLTPRLTSKQKEDYIENVLDTGKVMGKQYGIPMAFSSRTLFYRSDLIKNPPKNWQELLKVAKENTNEKMKGFSIPTDITHGTDEILNFIYQGGGRIVNEKGEFVINSPENIATLEFLASFKDTITDPVSTARKDQAKAFINNNLAMFISGGWEKKTLDSGKDKTPYKTAVVPEGPKKGVTLVTDSYTMSSISKHKDEAYKFIEFMGKLENQEIVTASHGWFPVLKEEQKNPKFQDEFNKPMNEIIQYGIAEPQVPNWDEFNKSFTIAVQKVLTGQSTSKEALDNCQKELTK